MYLSRERFDLPSVPVNSQKHVLIYFISQQNLDLSCHLYMTSDAELGWVCVNMFGGLRASGISPVIYRQPRGKKGICMQQKRGRGVCMFVNGGAFLFNVKVTVSTS